MRGGAGCHGTTLGLLTVMEPDVVTKHCNALITPKRN